MFKSRKQKAAEISEETTRAKKLRRITSGPALSHAQERRLANAGQADSSRDEEDNGGGGAAAANDGEVLSPFLTLFSHVLGHFRLMLG